MRYTSKDLIQEREARSIFQQNLMLLHKQPLVFIRSNYPGLSKTNALSEKIIKIIDKCVTDIFAKQILFKIYRITAEGPNIIMVIDRPIVEIKKLTLQIEDKHPLGSCVDIDVYNADTLMPLSRVTLGHSLRKCMICHEESAVCIRERRHEMKFVIENINNTYLKYKDIVN